VADNPRDGYSVTRSACHRAASSDKPIVAGIFDRQLDHGRIFEHRGSDPAAGFERRGSDPAAGCQSGLAIDLCQSRLTDMTDDDLSVRIRSTDPEVGLRAVGALHRLAELVEANHVAIARQDGWSWEQIGDALGVSRQSVHAKYGK
jgi:hypothetical protein